jgi:hypothetical protein
MADQKISNLTAASTPLAGTEVLPIVQDGSTTKVTVANLTAGRAVAMAGGSFTDNIAQGTAAKGINFTANTTAAGMTSQLLNWYEEGTWTPTVTSSVGAITSSTATGKYTRIGRQVTIELSVSVTDNGTGADGIRIGGLPFTAESTGYAGAGFNTSSGEALAVGFVSTTTLVVYKYNVLYPVITGQGFAIVVSYFV